MKDKLTYRNYHITTGGLGYEYIHDEYGLILDDGGYLFIETNKEKLDAFDPE